MKPYSKKILGLYPRNRIEKDSSFDPPVVRLFTLVGTARVWESEFLKSREALSREMDEILGKFEDSNPVIECVLAYHFLEKGSPTFIEGKDRQVIDNFFDLLKRLYLKDLKEGNFEPNFETRALHAKAGIDEFRLNSFRDEKEAIFKAKTKAQAEILHALRPKRFWSWLSPPERRPGRRSGFERVRSWMKRSERLQVGNPWIILHRDDLIMARGLACELASISRGQTSRDSSLWSKSTGAQKRAREGNPRDSLNEPLFQWVFGSSPEKYEEFRRKAELKVGELLAIQEIPEN